MGAVCEVVSGGGALTAYGSMFWALERPCSVSQREHVSAGRYTCLKRWLLHPSTS